MLCELDYLVARRLGVDAELAMLGDFAAGSYCLAPMDPGDVASARRIVERCRDLGIDLSDASGVALADKHRSIDILTLDERHFRAMRSSGGQPFRLLPSDRDE